MPRRNDPLPFVLAERPHNSLTENQLTLPHFGSLAMQVQLRSKFDPTSLEVRSNFTQSSVQSHSNFDPTLLKVHEV